jgi:hypothetical protein
MSSGGKRKVEFDDWMCVGWDICEEKRLVRGKATGTFYIRMGGCGDEPSGIHISADIGPAGY